MSYSQMFQGPFGINRNIVECKDLYRIQIVPAEYRINRNIVECKERRIWRR